MRKISLEKWVKDKYKDGWISVSRGLNENGIAKIGEVNNKYWIKSIDIGKWLEIKGWPSMPVYLIDPKDAAKIMGGKTSAKKKVSSKENGKKGGRPKKDN